MPYVQRKFYFPEDLYGQLALEARVEKQTITQTLRAIVADGLARRRQTAKSKGASALLELVNLAEKEGWGKHAPADLSINHDKYFVEAYEELKEGKKHRRP